MRPHIYTDTPKHTKTEHKLYNTQSIFQYIDEISHFNYILSLNSNMHTHKLVSFSLCCSVLCVYVRCACRRRHYDIATKNQSQPKTSMKQSITKSDSMKKLQRSEKITRTAAPFAFLSFFLLFHSNKSNKQLYAQSVNYEAIYWIKKSNRMQPTVWCAVNFNEVVVANEISRFSILVYIVYACTRMLHGFVLQFSYVVFC